MTKPPERPKSIAGGSAAQLHAAAGGGGGGKRRKGNLHLNVIQGVQNMKSYPLTEDQLENLADIGYLSTLFFSLSTALFSFAFSTWQNLSLSTAVNAEKIAVQTTVGWWTLIIAIVFFILGAFFLYKGRTSLKRIKNQVSFEAT
jgi:hypothetical protein